MSAKAVTIEAPPEAVRPWQVQIGETKNRRTL